MLENFNDILSLLFILSLFALAIWALIYVINLIVIEKNVKSEVKYYNYDKRKK